MKFASCVMFQSKGRPSWIKGSKYLSFSNKTFKEGFQIPPAYPTQVSTVFGRDRVEEGGMHANKLYNKNVLSMSARKFKK